MYLGTLGTRPAHPVESTRLAKPLRKASLTCRNTLCKLGLLCAHACHFPPTSSGFGGSQTRGPGHGCPGREGVFPRAGPACRGRSGACAHTHAPSGPTGVRPQVASEGVPPAACVIAEMTLKGLLPRVQLDVPKQVALLRERGPALVALERPLAWEEERGSVRKQLCALARGDRCRTREEVASHGGPVTSTRCRFDRTRGFQTKPASSLTLHWLGQFDLKI